MSEAIYSSKCLPEILELYESAKQYRKKIHMRPEIGFKCRNTVKSMSEFLQEHGVPKESLHGMNGSLICVINGSQPGATIALRGDIDGLPMEDLGTSEWKSKVKGAAHACGHDGHQTWLALAVIYLNQLKNFPGRVVAIFQTAEEMTEGYDRYLKERINGAGAVVLTGLFKKYDIKEIYGAHNAPFLDLGTFGFRPGPLMAACDDFKLKITGKGSHGGQPQDGLDPIPAAVQIYSALQTLVTRRISPFEPTVLSVCSINAGSIEAFNVVPTTASLSGTIRTYSPELRTFIEKEFKKIVEGIAAIHGVELDLTYVKLDAAVINDKECTKEAIEVTSDLVGKQHVLRNIPALTISEDFSSYLEVVPGCFFFIGTRDAQHPHKLHDPAFDFNDKVLPIAATLFVDIALRRLEKLSGSIAA